MTYDGQDFGTELRELIEKGVAEIGPKSVVMTLSEGIRMVTEARLGDNSDDRDNGRGATVGSGSGPGDTPTDSSDGSTNSFQIDTDNPLQ